MSAFTDIRERLGHTLPPSGEYHFTADIADCGIRDLEVFVEWALRGDQVCIERIEIDDAVDGRKLIDPLHGDGMHKELHRRLWKQAKARADDILERWEDNR